MAKAEYRLKGDFDAILKSIEEAAFKSVSASEEARSDFSTADTRCAVRVYERYSWTGSNRVSLSVTLLESGGNIFCSAIASGGSQAMFFKINTFGEEAFLDTVRAAVDRYRI